MTNQQSDSNDAASPKSEETLPAEVLKRLNTPSLLRDVKRFVRAIDTLSETLPFTMILVSAALRKSEEDLKSKFNQTEFKDDKGNTFYRFSGVNETNIFQFKKIKKRADKTMLAMQIIPQNYLVALISQFDVFVGNVVRSLYMMKPELLNASGKQFTFAELVKIGSIDAARESIIDKEIDAELRGSHTEHFEWLEKLSNADIRACLRDWSAFVEITERRNLFVHTGGVISRQYLDVCRKNHVNIDGLAKGDQIEISDKYFKKAHECVAETGIMLAQVMWRKLFPKDVENADSAFNEICFELLSEEKFELVGNLLEVAEAKFTRAVTSETVPLMMKINRAQAYKWSGQKDKMAQVLGTCDWSAKSMAFELAAAVLNDKIDYAIALMRKIGADGTPSKEDYRNWPLFRDFRKNQEFMTAFEEIFGMPFIQESPTAFKTTMFSAFDDKSGESADASETNSS